MIGTRFAKPLELDTLTRTVMRTVTREAQERVAYPVSREIKRTEQEPIYTTVKAVDGTPHQIVVGYTPREVTETVQDIEYRTEKRTVTEEVPEQEEYDNPAPNTFTKYCEAAQWCNANKARMVDCGDYYEVQALPELSEEEKIALLKSDYEATVEAWLAKFAATRGYKVSNMGAYANSTNPTFKAEALYYIELQDRTWEACYEILNAVLAGTRSVPTKEELYAELPVSTAQWPTPNPTAEQAAAL